MKPILIGTLGYPGSGKTHFSERLAKKASYFHLSADKIRHTLFEKPTYEPSEHKIVFGLIDYLAEAMLEKGVSVIYDANFNFKKSRQKLERIARKTGAKYRLVWIQTKEETALARTQKRARYKSTHKQHLYRPISVEVFNHLKSEIELPTKTEPVISIDGHASFEKQFESFKRGIR